MLLTALFFACREKESKTSLPTVPRGEKHRPLVHFSPPAHWMNDPNGMVFFNGTYHLFYQYYPDSTVWGPMHWGHATTKDLVHWTHQPIALYPDSLGYIFSGSAVVDSANTSGLAGKGKVPMVAIFTHHDAAGEKRGLNTYQNQSIAYSLDSGKTWTKYKGNPVLKNPGIKDFRDPKVSWHAATKRWIMTLATLDRITFYSSPDLKTWKKESEFGKNVGAHGGVWECPDLFPMKYNGEDIWVLIVSINPGGPNGGSATQYFTGKFDGHEFTTNDTTLKWIDNGPDDYAGVTWFNTGDRKIFLGWMSNWQYANVVPTERWRSAMTLPRDLSIEKIDGEYYVRSTPSKEIDKLETQIKTVTRANTKSINITGETGIPASPSILRIDIQHLDDFTITLSNKASEKTIVGFDKKSNNFYVDRTASGKTDFEKGFASKSTARRIAKADSSNVTLIIDDASVEVFADDGLTVLTAIYFPSEVYTDVTIASKGASLFNKVQHAQLQPVW